MVCSSSMDKYSNTAKKIMHKSHCCRQLCPPMFFHPSMDKYGKNSDTAKKNMHKSFHDLSTTPATRISADATKDFREC